MAHTDSIGYQMSTNDLAMILLEFKNLSGKGTHWINPDNIASAKAGVDKEGVEYTVLHMNSTTEPKIFIVLYMGLCLSAMHVIQNINVTNLTLSHVLFQYLLDIPFIQENKSENIGFHTKNLFQDIYN